MCLRNCLESLRIGNVVCLRFNFISSKSMRIGNFQVRIHNKDHFHRPTGQQQETDWLHILIHVLFAAIWFSFNFSELLSVRSSVVFLTFRAVHARSVYGDSFIFYKTLSTLDAAINEVSGFYLERKPSV